MKNQTVAAYDKYHEVYDQETVSFWESFPKKTLKAFTNNLPGKLVLDLGSGAGRDAILLRKEGLNVLCFDASTEMIKRTKKLGFESVLGDVRKLKFPDRCFDGIWAYTSLLHITKPEAKKVISKLHNLLKKDGILLIGMIEGSFEGMMERQNMPGVKRYFRYYTANELRKMVEDGDFRFVSESRYTPHTNTYISQIFLVK